MAFDKMTQDLKAKNAELTSFHVLVSHSLKEPLRSISAYSKFIFDSWMATSIEKRLYMVLIFGYININQ